MNRQELVKEYAKELCRINTEISLPGSFYREEDFYQAAYELATHKERMGEGEFSLADVAESLAEKKEKERLESEQKEIKKCRGSVIYQVIPFFIIMCVLSFFLGSWTFGYYEVCKAWLLGEMTLVPLGVIWNGFMFFLNVFLLLFTSMAGVAALKETVYNLSNGKYWK